MRPLLWVLSFVVGLPALLGAVVATALVLVLLRNFMSWIWYGSVSYDLLQEVASAFTVRQQVVLLYALMCFIGVAAVRIYIWYKHERHIPTYQEIALKHATETYDSLEVRPAKEE